MLFDHFWMLAISGPSMNEILIWRHETASMYSSGTELGYPKINILDANSS